jgi:hypothetical protein
LIWVYIFGRVTSYITRSYPIKIVAYSTKGNKRSRVQLSSSHGKGRVVSNMKRLVVNVEHTAKVLVKQQTNWQTKISV